MLTSLLLFLLLGVIAGLLAGLLGVGGGLIIVPVLAVLLPDVGIHNSLVMHVALGTSLATIVATSMASAWEHQKHHAVLWPVFWRLTPGIVIGAWLGAAVAEQMASQLLQRVFGIFELLVAMQIFFGFGASAHRQLPGAAMTGIAGTVIGSVSAIVGIGGGTMTVPFLVWCNVTIRKAVATSAAVGLPIALAGSSGYILAGMSDSGLPEWSSGYVYWPAFAAIISTSLLLAPVGARLAHRMPMSALKKGFALLLVVLGVRMLISTG
ncbi:MAG TPA: sulfite exporter TauE/SafE family protein [Gammaproteobacteria bacterium]|nr:sulfite exporter TauE/SafE family protein [Gammaproteobacteria bacterium]